MSVTVFYFVILQPVLSVVWVADMEKNSCPCDDCLFCK
ncbi:hypothetical protein M108_3151 [Bacteroides fragilis str. 3397 T14]|nr:hypothetical protein M108_3151 [Bacteroides fragilis str. 3397 T14]